MGYAVAGWLGGGMILKGRGVLNSSILGVKATLITLRPEKCVRQLVTSSQPPGQVCIVYICICQITGKRKVQLCLHKAYWCQRFVV